MDDASSLFQLELAFSPWMDVPRATVWVLLTVFAILVLHLRTVGWRQVDPARYCWRCGYPEKGMPTGALCPECGGTFEPKKERRILKYDWTGACQSLLVVLAFAGAYASSPMIWAAWYRADGWLRMRPTDIPCLFRTSELLGLGLALTVILLPILSLRKRCRSWLFALLLALVAMGSWIGFLRLVWESGAVTWHGQQTIHW